MKNLFNSVLFDVDSYKVSMPMQYPPKTKFISSYIEARKENFDFRVDGKVPFIGLQPILSVLEEEITEEKVMMANKFWTAHGEPFPLEGWMKIVNEHNGKLPLRIEALSEGSIVGTQNVMAQVTNTHEDFWWLPTWVETKLLRVWYPVTVSTKSLAIKTMLKEYAEKTQDNPFIDFSLHDFGSRGASSSESSAIGGIGHMLNFRGTDSANCLVHIMEHYKNVDGPVGFSIPAAEHSTITSWGKENELSAFENMLKQFGKGTFAVVSDSYDYFNALEKYWGEKLKNKVLSLEGNLVVRPDSGDPVEVVQQSLEMLWEKFGGTINSKGYKVLHDKIRVIQGDGVDYHPIRMILDRIERKGFSTENVAFGMGGALLQKVNRDDLAFAMKASAAFIDDKWVDVFKDPITDKGKKSKKGRLAIYKENDTFFTCRLEELPDGIENELIVVFENGHKVNVPSWEEVMETYNSFM